MTDTPSLSDEITIVGEFNALYERATTDEGDKGWRIKLPFAQRDKPDRNGALVQPADGVCYDQVRPFHKDHGLRGDKERLGWGYVRMLDSGRQAFLDATLPDTARSRDFIEELEHDQKYNRGGVSGGFLYIRSETRRPTPEQRKLGASWYIPKWDLKEVSYTTVDPLLPGMTAELVRSMDALEQELSVYKPSEKAAEILKARSNLLYSDRVQEIMKRRVENVPH